MHSHRVISHTNDKQYHEFYLNDETFVLVNNLEEGIFSGKRIIHTLILLFIKFLRCLPNFYEEALNNYANIDVLSDLFCEILHPGIIEFRYPMAIAIEESYTKIIHFPKTKCFSENELSNCLQSIDNFQIAINNGLSAAQGIILSYNSITYIGSLLSFAVLNRKNEIVDYILENNIDPIFERNGILTPIEAAHLIHDNEMVIKLLCGGTSHGYGIRTLSPLILEKLQVYFKYINTNNILFIFKHSYYFVKLEILKLFSRNISNCQHKSVHELSVFKIMLSELFKSGNEEELMTFFIRERNEALISIVIEQLVIIYLDEIGSLKENDWRMLDYCLTETPFHFIEPKSMKILLNIIKSHIFFNKYYQTLSCESALVFLRYVEYDLIGSIKFILSHKHKKREYILLNYIHRHGNIKCDSALMLELFTLLQDFPVAQLKLIEKVTSNTLSDTVISFIVDIATHSFINYEVRKMLIRIFLKNDIANDALHRIMQIGSAEKLAKFLFFIFDNLILLENFQFSISKESKQLISCNILAVIELFEKFNYPFNLGLKQILNKLLNTFDLAKEITEKIMSKVDPLNPDSGQNVSALGKNANLAIKKAAVIFITQVRNKDLYVYMGRKKQSIVTDLIAPGGYLQSTELPLNGAIREANEETQLNFNLSNLEIPSARDAVRCFNMSGELSLDNVTELPAKITFLHKYKRIDAFKEPARNFTLFFFWFELAQGKVINLISSDDFVDGTWISAASVKYCPHRNAYYNNDLKVATSNALLLEVMQSRQISKTVLDEEIFNERYFRETKQHPSHRFFNSTQTHVQKKPRISNANELEKKSIFP